MQSQVTFNRVPEKALGGFGAEPGQVQQGSGEGFGEGSWCKAKSGSTGSGEGCREGPGAGPGQVPTCSTGFPALGFSACFRKICKNKRCGCLLGIPPKLIFLFFLNVGPKIWRSIPFEASPPKSVSGNFFGTPLCGRKSWARGRTAADWADDFMAKLLRTAALTS